MILPKVLRFSRLLEGATKSGWFQALNISYRNSRLMSSLNLKFLKIPRSQLLRPGPRRTPRPALPSLGAVSAGTTKALKSQKATLRVGRESVCGPYALVEVAVANPVGASRASGRADVRSCQGTRSDCRQSRSGRMSPPEPPNRPESDRQHRKDCCRIACRARTEVRSDSSPRTDGERHRWRAPWPCPTGFSDRSREARLPVSSPCPKTSTSYNSPTWRTRRSGVSPL